MCKRERSSKRNLPDMVVKPMSLTDIPIKWVPKSWGGEQILVNNNLYCGKILFFIKDKKCSVHFHKTKTESFHLLSGKMMLYYTDNIAQFEENIKNNKEDYKSFMDSKLLQPGCTFHIPQGRVHQMLALENSQLLEISTEDFVDDSYRIIKGD